VENNSVENILAIAKKYYLWSHPIIEQDIAGEFRKAVTQEPSFDGKTKDVKLAAKLSYDSALMGVNGIPNATLALACVVFDMAPTAVWAAQNLGCAIAMFCDNNDDDAIRMREAEIYADAEKVLQYALWLSLTNGNPGANSAGPLVCLGNLYLDTNRQAEAQQFFETAMNVSGGSLQAMNAMTVCHKLKGNKRGVNELAMKASMNNSTLLAKAYNELDKKVNEGAPSREGDLENEAVQEQYMEELCKIEVVTYADLFGPIDPTTAAKMKADAASAAVRMKIRIPDMTVITQFTTVNEENKRAVQSAMEAANQEAVTLGQFNARYSKHMVRMQADTLDNMGIQSRIGGMAAPDFMRAAADNPMQFRNATNISVDPNLANELMSKAMSQANDMMKSLEKMMAGGTDDLIAKMGGGFGGGGMSDDAKDLFKQTSKLDPIQAINALDPFDYANPWDIIVQKENVHLFEYNKSALIMYIGSINGKTTEGLMQMRENFGRRIDQLEQTVHAESSSLADLYHNDKISSDEYMIRLHRIHTTYYPQVKALIVPWFGQATQATSMAYKKLEKYVPKMYQSAMKHLMCISDEKIRDDEEKKLIGLISGGISTAIGNLLQAYAIGNQLLDIRECGCDEEMLRAMERRLEEYKRTEGNAMIEEQKRKKNSFNDGEIDENSSFYKNFIKKYEYTIDFGFMKYKSNLHQSTSSITLWTPFGSIDHSSYKNHMTGRSGVSADLTLSLGDEVDPLKGEAKFGFSISRDRNGKVHPRDVDLRASLEVGTNMPYLSATAGMSASLMRGTKVYGGASASSGHIDDYKERLGTMGNYVPVSSPTLELWSGEYSITERN